MREGSKEWKKGVWAFHFFFCASKLITWNKSFEYSLHGGGCKHFHAWSRPAAERSALSIHPAALLWIDNPKLAGGRRSFNWTPKKTAKFSRGGGVLLFSSCLIDELLGKYVTCCYLRVLCMYRELTCKKLMMTKGIPHVHSVLTARCSSVATDVFCFLFYCASCTQ